MGTQCGGRKGPSSWPRAAIWLVNESCVAKEVPPSVFVQEAGVGGGHILTQTHPAPVEKH